MSFYGKDDRWIEITAAIMAVSLGIGIAMAIAIYQCGATWEQSGMESRWRLLAGCQLQTKPGVWIPADQYRTLD